MLKRLYGCSAKFFVERIVKREFAYLCPILNLSCMANGSKTDCHETI
ncbi:hypothetical protein PORCAN_7 [Porphyromonas crevioricanis JCM 13913]|nr:hypothetical protein PORCAN_7 [Porphyromonas crevioricanis JCM 13913]